MKAPPISKETEEAIKNLDTSLTKEEEEFLSDITSDY